MKEKMKCGFAKEERKRADSLSGHLAVGREKKIQKHRTNTKKKMTTHGVLEGFLKVMEDEMKFLSTAVSLQIDGEVPHAKSACLIFFVSPFSFFMN